MSPALPLERGVRFCLLTGAAAGTGDASISEDVGSLFLCLVRKRISIGGRSPVAAQASSLRKVGVANAVPWLLTCGWVLVAVATQQYLYQPLVLCFFFLCLVRKRMLSAIAARRRGSGAGRRQQAARSGRP